ncbi:MAG: calcium-binding protein [Methylotenera sp.]|nr:calcium-binding protein [Methylotenera sp.]
MADFEIELNDTQVTANTLTSDVAMGGQLMSAGDLDTFKFTTTEATTLELSFTAPLFGAFNVRFFNTAGVTLATYNLVSGFNALLAVPLPDTYYFQVAAGDYYHGQYELQVNTGSKFAELEDNGTIPTANSVPLGKSVTGQIGGTADVDFYKFSFVNTGLASVSFDSPLDGSNGDTYRISVFDTNGIQISSHTTTGDLASFNFSVPVTGNYHVSVAAGNSASWDSHDYSLLVTSSGDTAAVATQIIGGNGNDYISGGSGDDQIDGGLGNDDMHGFIGDDAYIVDNLKDKIVEAVNEGVDFVTASINVTGLAANVENLTLSEGSDLLLNLIVLGKGNALDNSITGNGNDNQLFGLAGNDRLDGGIGADTMNGGTGDDVYVVDNVKDLIIETSTGNDTVLAKIDILKLADNVENIILSDGVSLAIGNGRANTLSGTDSFNQLQGLGGNDTINGFGGNDDIRGGSGNDLLDGGNGNDFFMFDTSLSATTNVDTIVAFESQGDHLRLSHSIFSKLAKGYLSVNNFFAYSGDSSGQGSDDYILFDDLTGVLYYDADGSGARAKVAFAKFVDVTNHVDVVGLVVGAAGDIVVV